MKTSIVRILAALLVAGACFTSCRQPNDPTPPPPTVETPNITAQPQSAVYSKGAAGTVGTSLTVTAAVTDGGQLSYQWYSADADNSESAGSPLNGATSSSYAPPIDTVGKTAYYAVVTNTLNSRTATATSNRATIEVNTKVNAVTPQITTQPAASTAYSQNAAPVALTVVAQVGDGGTLSYQWYKNTSASNEGGTAISGQISAAYTPSTAAVGTTYYYVVITNTIANNGDGGVKTAKVSSSVATVEVNMKINATTPVISAHPQSGIYGKDNVVTLSVTASGNGTLSYQWYSNDTNNNTSGQVINGKTETTYTPPTDTVGIKYYYVIVTNTIANNGDGGNKTAAAASTPAKIEVNTKVNAAAPVISAHPQAAIYRKDAAADPLSVAAAATDGGTLSYKWYSNAADSNTGGTVISNATSATYIPPTAVVGTVYYYVEVINTITDNGDGGNKTASGVSNPARILIEDPAATDAVVYFRVNNAGTGFENAGTGGASYSASAVGGSFTTINGNKVFYTGGADSGADVTAPWDASVSWDRYVDVGYVDLGASTGALLGTLPSFTIETNVWLPENYQIVSLGNYLWSFGNLANAPSQAVYFSYRDSKFRIISGGDNDVNGTYNSIPLGQWHHIVLVKDNATVTAYVDGAEHFSGTQSVLTTAIGGSALQYNYLGKPLYAADESIHQSMYYNFAIYGSAKTADQVAALYSAGPVASGSLTPVVNAQQPHLSTQPQDQSVNKIPGAAVPALTVTATTNSGDPDTAGTLSYQWYSNTANSTSGGAAISGATSASYTPLVGTGKKWYYAAVTNAIANNNDGGVKSVTVLSRAAEVDCYSIAAASVVIDTQPAGATYSQGATAIALTVTAAASGDDAAHTQAGTLSYQWYSNAANSTSGGTAISGATSASFVPPTTSQGTTYYYVKITNAIADNSDGGAKTATATSSVAAIDVNNLINAATPVITAQPSGAAYFKDATAAALTVTATRSDAGALTYQWYSNASNSNTGGAAATGTGASGSLTSGASGSTFAPSTAVMGTTYYYVVITNTITDNGDGGAKTATVTSSAVAVKVVYSYAPSGAVVSFQVNPEGAGFTNRGSGGATYAATNAGGSFAVVNGANVFNTGGTETTEDQEIPWWSGHYWKRWENIGYVDMNGATGDYIGGLSNYTVETYFRLPANAQIDRVGQHLWNFSDKEGPDNALWLNIREFQFMHKKAQSDTPIISNWDNASANRTPDVWHHVVLVKEGDTATIYVDGASLISGAVPNETFSAGTLVYNHLAKPCYEEYVNDQTLFNTDYFSFTIFNSAKSASDVAAMYSSGPMASGGPLAP